MTRTQLSCKAYGCLVSERDHTHLIQAYNDAVAASDDLLRRADPDGLLLAGAPSDEYDSAARDLARATDAMSVGGELVIREDDTEAALERRLRDHRQKTDPVLELFRRKGYVLNVDAGRDPLAVAKGSGSSWGCRMLR